MNDAARVAKNTGFLYIRILINILVSLYSTRIVLEALGVDDFGIYNLIAGAIAMFVFLNSAMAEATQRFMSHALGEKNFKKQQSVFNVGIIIHFIIAILIVLILEVAGYFLFKGVLVIPDSRMYSAKIVYQFMVISNFFIIITVPYNAILNAHENMFIVALFGIVESLIKLGIAIYITFTQFDQLITYGLLMAISSVLLLLTTRVYCHVKYDEVNYNIKKHFDWKIFKEMGSFASWTLVSHSTWIITMQGTSVVLNSFFGVFINAAQGIANQVTNQLKGFSMTLLRALNPFIVKKEGEKNRQKMLEAAMLGNKISFFILSFLSIPLLVEMPYVLDLWLKDVPEYAVIFCRLSLVQILIGALTQTFYYAIGAIGKIKKFSLWESTIVLSVLPLSYLMFYFGLAPEVIYINLILMITGMGVVRLYFINKHGGLSMKDIFNKVIFRCISVFGFSVLIPLLFLSTLDSGFLRLIFVTFSSFVALTFSILLFGLNSVERKQIYSILFHFRKKLKI